MRRFYNENLHYNIVNTISRQSYFIELVYTTTNKTVYNNMVFDIILLFINFLMSV